VLPANRRKGWAVMFATAIETTVNAPHETVTALDGLLRSIAIDPPRLERP
jgi:hypothetical protein